MGIADVSVLDLQPWTVQGHVGDSGHPGEGFWRAVGEVVEDEQVVTSFKQDQAGVAADETGAAGHQNTAAHAPPSRQDPLILMQLPPAGRLGRC